LKVEKKRGNPIERSTVREVGRNSADSFIESQRRGKAHDHRGA
jgi:hypothetical protein